MNAGDNEAESRKGEYVATAEACPSGQRVQKASCAVFEQSFGHGDAEGDGCVDRAAGCLAHQLSGGSVADQSGEVELIAVALGERRDRYLAAALQATGHGALGVDTRRGFSIMKPGENLVDGVVTIADLDGNGRGEVMLAALLPVMPLDPWIAQYFAAFTLSSFIFGLSHLLADK